MLEELHKEFERIKSMGWVKQKESGYASIGNTFEDLLGKEKDELPFPDYGKFEIKTINENAKTNLHLFTLTPDSVEKFPMKEIIDKLGCPLNGNKERKVFFRSFVCGNYTSIGKYKKGTILVKSIKQKVDLQVLDEKERDIGIHTYWTFKSLKERLYQKLKYLAVVVAKSKIDNNEGYYYYYKINYYKLKSFNVFLSLIEKGIISITFKIGVFKGGRRDGEVHDHKI